MQTKHTDTQIQNAINYAFGACPSSRLTTYRGDLNWTTEAPFRLAIAEDFLEKLKPEPETSTFEAHGKTWTRHTPGDAMPKLHGKKVFALDKSGSTWSTKMDVKQASYWEDADYSNPFIGWRYADEQSELVTTPWTPAVGDVVQLKSGGPKMTIAALSEQTSLVPCQWFGGKNPRSHAFPQACLTLVTE